MEYLLKRLCSPFVGLTWHYVWERFHCKARHDLDLWTIFIDRVLIFCKELFRHFDLIYDQVVSIWSIKCHNRFIYTFIIAKIFLSEECVRLLVWLRTLLSFCYHFGKSFVITQNWCPVWANRHSFFSPFWSPWHWFQSFFKEIVRNTKSSYYQSNHGYWTFR